MKVFDRKIIPASSYERKGPVDIDILIAPGSGDKKMMQAIRIISSPPTRMRRNQFSQFR